MKKNILILALSSVLLTGAFCDNLFNTNSGLIGSAQGKLEFKAFSLFPCPITTNFLERKIIYDWTLRWDKPDIPCYSYFFIGSTCIGYFITHGKPASTRSYLLPETYLGGYENGNRQSPDVDGTYGENNPGYRFFLANGTAVECSGYMVSCIYADAPLDLVCNQIKTIQKK